MPRRKVCPGLPQSSLTLSRSLTLSHTHSLHSHPHSHSVFPSYYLTHSHSLSPSLSISRFLSLFLCVFADPTEDYEIIVPIDSQKKDFQSMLKPGAIPPKTSPASASGKKKPYVNQAVVDAQSRAGDDNQVSRTCFEPVLAFGTVGGRQVGRLGVGKRVCA